MRKEAIVLTIAVFLIMLGIFLADMSVTGNIVFDETVKNLCESSNDCEGPEVCCYFYEENAGVCHHSIFCPGIEELTREEKLSKEDNVIKVINEFPKSGDEVPVEYLLGVLLVIIAIFLIFNYLKVKEEVKKTNKVKKKKTMRK